MHSKPAITYSAYGDVAWTRKYSYAVPSVAEMTKLLDNYDKFIPYASQTVFPYAYGVPIPEWSEVADTLAFAVSSAIAKEKAPKQALDEAADKVTKIMDKAGYYKPGVPEYTHGPVPKVEVKY